MPLSAKKWTLLFEQDLTFMFAVGGAFLVLRSGMLIIVTYEKKFGSLAPPWWTPHGLPPPLRNDDDIS